MMSTNFVTFDFFRRPAALIYQRNLAFVTKFVDTPIALEEEKTSLISIRKWIFASFCKLRTLTRAVEGLSELVSG